MQQQQNIKKDTVTAVEHYDELTLGVEIFGWVEALGAAIADASKNDIWGPARVRRLASLAQHLGEAWRTDFQAKADDIATAAEIKQL